MLPPRAKRPFSLVDILPCPVISHKTTFRYYLDVFVFEYFVVYKSLLGFTWMTKSLFMLVLERTVRLAWYRLWSSTSRMLEIRSARSMSTPPRSSWEDGTQSRCTTRARIRFWPVLSSSISSLWPSSANESRYTLMLSFPCCYMSGVVVRHLRAKSGV